MPLAAWLVAQVEPGLVDACGSRPGWVCETVYDLTGNGVLAGLADWLVERPLRIFLILAVAFVLNRLVRRLINRGMARIVARLDEAEREAQEAQADEPDSFPEAAARQLRFLTERTERARLRATTLGAVLRNTASVIIYGLAFFLVLGELDINLGPLIAGAGIAGIAIGFGAQSVVRDFLSGVFMLIEDQYGVGDVVDVGDATGVVEAVSLRVTRLRDVNGVVWHVPNGEIRRVGNKSQKWARAVLDVEVAYDTDLDHAFRVIKQVADEVWQAGLETATVLEEPQILGVENFGENSIAIRLAVKTEPGEQFATARQLRSRLKTAFDREGIEIPFPQRTLWMRTPQEAQLPTERP